MKTTNYIKKPQPTKLFSVRIPLDVLKAAQAKAKQQGHTLADIIVAGLLICECGNPRNNHFDFGKRQCAHNVDCKGYKEIARYGALVRKRKNR